MKKYHGNSKAVICITTGDKYESLSEAAKALGLSKGTLSRAINLGVKSKGNEFCFVSQIGSHIDKVSEIIHSNHTKAREYDRMIAHRKAIKDTAEECEQRRAKIQKLEQMLDQEYKHLNVAEVKLNSLKREELN